MSILLALSIVMSTGGAVSLPASISDDLAKQGRLGIKPEQCREVEAKLGQTFYMTVDGYGTKQTVASEYNDLVGRIQPGGILPHFQNHGLGDLRVATDKLKQVSKMPLMIGVDYEKVYVGDAGKTATLGMGYYQGLIGKLNRASPECYEKVGYLEGLLHRAIGLNHALGPTVEFRPEANFTPAEKNERINALMNGLAASAVETTLKHFPYTPSDYSLETQSKDTAVPASEVDAKYMPVYKEFANRAGFAMSTHLLNSQVDPNNMTTFSRKWTDKLRNEANFNGILMTDALFMISRYKDTMNSLTRTWTDTKNVTFHNDVSIFAAKALLAGHDMIFLESPAKETAEVFSDLVSLACQNSSTGQRLRSRVLTAFDKIKAYKDKNRDALNTSQKLPAPLVEKLIAARAATDVCAVDISSIKREVAMLDQTKQLCHDFHHAQPAGIQDLANLHELVAHMSPNELREAILSNDAALIDEVLPLINQRPELKNKILAEAEQQFATGTEKERLNAIQTMKALDTWPPSVLRNALTAKDPKVLSQLMQQARYSDLPAVDLPPETILTAANRLRETDRTEASAGYTKHLTPESSEDDQSGRIKDAIASGALDQRSGALLSSYFTKSKIEGMGVEKFLDLPVRLPEKTRLLVESGATSTDVHQGAIQSQRLIQLATKDTSNLSYYNAKAKQSGEEYTPLDVIRNRITGGWANWTADDKSMVTSSLDELKRNTNANTRLFAYQTRLELAPTSATLTEYLSAIQSSWPALKAGDKTAVRGNLANVLNSGFVTTDPDGGYVIKLPTDQAQHVVATLASAAVLKDDDSEEQEYWRKQIDRYQHARIAPP